ncbi:unnamed protein product [Fraxinus pennsylvanica]|uniref:Pre-mRNA-splicing factor SLU7 n=1 Tax=Fraxinus pennsylvanica TaxID=56036 RepID=A0AAD1ZZM5_9LAMI|nr:unnamed protein product [Fraxinus pennsylvanica]
MDRPRKLGAKWTGKSIVPDEKIETYELDYEGKRDRWNGYDAASYKHVIEGYEASEARRKYLKEQQLKKLEEKNGNQNEEGGVSDDEGNEDDLKVDEAKVDESKQMDFTKVERRLRTTGGGGTGTGDNCKRVSGQALEFKQLKIHAWEAFDKGHDVHMQAAPSEAELLYKNFNINKEKLKFQRKESHGEVRKNHKRPDVDMHSHLLFSESFKNLRQLYRENRWNNEGGKILTVRNNYCNGAAGIEASEAAADLMKANIACKEITEATLVEEKRLATWGSEVPDVLFLDEKKLAEALKNKDDRRREEKDERKRKYNVKWNDEVTPEDMEAYRMKRVHQDDPMKDFLH